MEKILLFSDDEKLFEITKQVTEGKQELVWGNYQCLETNRYPFADVVIMHFDAVSYTHLRAHETTLHLV